MDTLTPAERSRRMSAVRSKDTKPELAVRKRLHACGYRYRLHVRGLPGSPDLVFPSRKKVLFVHGCFWHRHDACKLARLPKSRQDFWLPKLEKNKHRDASKLVQLNEAGWRAMVVWECETKDLDALMHRIIAFLEDKHE